MKIVKKGMTSKQRMDTASTLAHDFLEKCDGMYGDEMADILHWHFLFCMAQFCDSIDMDMREALKYSIEFLQDAIDDLNSHDKKLN